MNDGNYYALLGVRRTASEAEIRHAYVLRLKSKHPDMKRTGTYPMADVADLQRAYRCLSNPASRSAHDAALQSADVARFSRIQKMQRRLTRKPRAASAKRRVVQSGRRLALRWRPLLIASLLALIAIEVARRR